MPPIEWVDEPQPEWKSNRMLKWFAYGHLPQHLQAISRPFGELAELIASTVPNGPEQTVALRKLLEAKDHRVVRGLGLRSNCSSG